MACEVKHVSPCITCHTWNADHSLVALCPNTSEVEIYKKAGKEYSKVETLTEHDQVVMSIDWAHETDRIVSCSQDRNAYVFTRAGKGWKPTLVILRINRAATYVRWSPKENKFAVASGAKLLSVCYFDEDNDWWVAKHIKRHRSSVVSVDWHPDNVLLATGSTDFKCRIFSAFVRGPDKRGNETLFGKDPKFGECLMEFDCGTGWVHAVAWTPAGTHLAYVGHDSTVSFVDNATDANSLSCLKLPNLPFRCLSYLTDSSVVAVGYDCAPYLFLYNESEGWKCAGSIDKVKEAAKPQQKSATASAFKMFQDQSSRGRVVTSAETSVSTQHQNAITGLCVWHDPAGGRPKFFSTCGVDGRIAVWNVAAIEGTLGVQIV